MSVAFFDIDKTVIAINSAKGWLQHEITQRTISAREAARGLFWAGLYGLGVADLEHVIREVVGSLEGREEAPLEEEIARFYAREVAHTVRPGAVEAMAQHRLHGDRIVLLTSSSDYIARLVCAQLECDGFSSNAFRVAQGRFTGECEEPLCFGAGKIAHARRWVERDGSSLREASFYTDSYSDLPLLRLVGHPYVVHPDVRLAREARRQGWPVLEWGG